MYKNVMTRKLKTYVRELKVKSKNKWINRKKAYVMSLLTMISVIATRK
jgi:hypothetical protein